MELALRSRRSMTSFVRPLRHAELVEALGGTGDCDPMGYTLNRSKP
jgi:hypothetical protein